MKTILRIIILLLLIINISGCQKKNLSDSDNLKDGNNIITINVLRETSGTVFPEDENNFIVNTLREKLGVNIAANKSVNELSTILNTSLAGGDPPDYFQVPSYPIYRKYVANNLLLEVTPYEDRLGTYINFIGQQNYDSYKVDDKQFSFPSSRQISYSALWQREDLLRKQGIASPKTVNELLTASKKLTTGGRYGIGGLGLATFESIFGAYGVTASYDMWAKFADNKTRYLLLMPEYYSAIAKIKEFFDAGVVYPEIFSAQYTDIRNAAFQGKIAFFMEGWPNLSKDEFVKQYQAVDPDTNFVPLNVLKQEGSLPAIFAAESQSSAVIYASPYQLKDKPAKLNKLIEVLNYLSTNEGNRLVSYGLEGVHYNLVDGEVVPTERMAKEAGFSWIYQLSGRNEVNYLKTKFPYVKDRIDFTHNLPHIEFITTIPASDAFSPTDYGSFVGGKLIEFITGKTDLAEWGDFIAQVQTTFGLNENINYQKGILQSRGFIVE